ncbi:hypothetical protein V8J88_02280 [Massilia sp. W12]|uniref:hypothetical protein n=1 Tax=Massilia sp. W12 TaxID=3126507 RepID=UPI0030D4023B
MSFLSYFRSYSAALLAGAISCLSLPAQAQLQVHSARWEVLAGGNESCDASAQLQRICNGRRFCQVAVTPENLCHGDPAYGKQKVLEIQYSCDGVRQQHSGFPDGAIAALRCERGGNLPRITINSARWEAPGAGSCDALRQIGRACNGKDICDVFVDQRYVCGSDPAYGVAKQLNIQYSCNGRQQSMLSFGDGQLGQINCRNSQRAPSSPVVSNPPPNRAPVHGGRLQVQEARWEVVGGGSWCDATRQMSAACDGKSECDVPVAANYLCNGDPAYGKQKRLDVKFTCNGVQMPQLGFFDGGIAQLRCSGSVSNPTGVQRGSHSGGSHHGSGLYITGARWEVNGGGAWCDATPQMGVACNGRRYCELRVEPRNLCDGDPAPGRYKTLEVRYNCNGRQQSAVGFPDGSMAALRCE